MPKLSLKDVQRLVTEGEHTTLEFKRKAKFPEKIVKELVAFANTEGGWLFIGVEDDGTIYGCPNPDEEEFVMVQAIKKYISPDLKVGFQQIRVAGEHAVVALYISAEQPDGPYSVVTDGAGRERTTYIRWQDESVQASREMRELLKYRKKMKQVRVEIGNKERLLFQYLTQHDHITVSEFAKIADIPNKIAGRTLVLLALTDLLTVIPGEDEDKWQATDNFTTH